MIVEPPIAAEPESSMPDELVFHVRVNYKSGCYIQTWFKKFDVIYRENGEIASIEWLLAEVQEEVVGQMAYPLVLNIEAIESVWVMSTMSASELYSKSMKV